LHHVLHHHHSRHHAHHRHSVAVIIVGGLVDHRRRALQLCGFSFALRLDGVPRLVSFVDDLAVLNESIYKSLLLFFADNVPIDVHLQNVLKLDEGLPILAADTLVNNPPFVVASIILVYFLLDGDTIRYSNPATHLDPFGHKPPLAFTNDSGGASGATHGSGHSALTESRPPGRFHPPVVLLPVPLAQPRAGQGERCLATFKLI